MYGNTLCIPYTSRDFPSGIDPGTGVLDVKWDDLLWATLTVGRPNTAHLLAHGDASYYEALFRLSLVRMALEQRRYNESLYRTDAFKTLWIDLPCLGYRRGLRSRRVHLRGRRAKGRRAGQCSNTEAT